MKTYPIVNIESTKLDFLAFLVEHDHGYVFFSFGQASNFFQVFYFFLYSHGNDQSNIKNKHEFFFYVGNLEPTVSQCSLLQL